MSLLDRVRIGADIAKIASEIYGLIVEKSRKTAEREARIKALEQELTELKRKLEEAK